MPSDDPLLYETPEFQEAVEVFIEQTGREPITDGDFEGPNGVLAIMEALQQETSPESTENSILQQMGEQTGSKWQELFTSLPPCETEDSDNCSWDAQVQGNGEGQSFISVNGQVFYEGDEVQ